MRWDGGGGTPVTFNAQKGAGFKFGAPPAVVRRPWDTATAAKLVRSGRQAGSGVREADPTSGGSSWRSSAPSSLEAGPRVTS